MPGTIRSFAKSFGHSQAAPLLFRQHLTPSTDAERIRFVKLYRRAQETQLYYAAQRSGKSTAGLRDTGYEFHTMPRWVMVIDAVKPINLGVRKEKPVEARSITGTVCSTHKFVGPSGRIVTLQVCDGIGKVIPARNWRCYETKTPATQQGKIKHLLHCVRGWQQGSCLSQKEVKALIPEIRDARGQLEALWKRGEVETDTLTKQVLTKDGNRLSPEQMAKIPPSLWDVEIRERKISPAALRRHRTIKGKFLPRQTLACFRAPRR